MKKRLTKRNYSHKIEKLVLKLFSNFFKSLISGHAVNVRRDEPEIDARHVRVVERKVTKSGDKVSRFLMASTTTPRLLCSSCQK